MDGWRSVVEMKEPFLLEGMSQPTVLAFCIEDSEYIANVEQEGGADLAGGKELIKSIQVGFKYNLEVLAIYCTANFRVSSHPQSIS